jgi:hypothetical protein
MVIENLKVWLKVELRAVHEVGGMLRSFRITGLDAYSLINQGWEEVVVDSSCISKGKHS